MTHAAPVEPPLGERGQCRAADAHAAGAVTPTEEKVASLVHVIREAGRIPVQRDTFYNKLRTFDGP